jgi:prepilin-type N-terminal cleavage/methylation domain-containing protein
LCRTKVHYCAEKWNLEFHFWKEKKGFTLAELLIVVAIIAVLVAISIPIFTAQLEKSREATDIANLRAAYAAGTAEALTQSDETTKTGWTKIYTTDGQLVDESDKSDKGVKCKATQLGWKITDPGLTWTNYKGESSDGVIKVTYTPGQNGAEGKVTVNFS